MAGKAGVEPASSNYGNLFRRQARYIPIIGANRGDQTLDLHFTEVMHYQLCYVGVKLVQVVRIKLT